jgi:metal-dependent hydrolase (beta-lactamase superfamily II)
LGEAGRLRRSGDDEVIAHAHIDHGQGVLQASAATAYAEKKLNSAQCSGPQDDGHLSVVTRTDVPMIM